MTRQRGASSALCGSRPWSSIEDTTWRWPCGCISPPITPKRTHRSPVAGEEPGNDRMPRTLATRRLVAMSGLQGEARSAVLERDPRVRHHHAGAEPHVVRLDVAHHHAVAVRRAEVHGPAARRLSGAEGLRALSDQGPARGEVAGIEHPAHRHVRAARIRHVATGIRERELHRLDLAMPALGAAVRRLAQGGAFDDPQRLQRRDPPARSAGSPRPRGPGTRRRSAPPIRCGTPRDRRRRADRRWPGRAPRCARPVRLRRNPGVPPMQAAAGSPRVPGCARPRPRRGSAPRT